MRASLTDASPLLRAMALRSQVRYREELAIATDKPREEAADPEHQQRESLVRQAMATPWEWLLKHTRTYNEHWSDEGLPSPNEPFPPFDYLRYTLQILASDEKVIAIEKSRDMMASWLCVGFFTYMAQKRPYTQCLFQSLEREKANELVGYAKQLWRSQSKALRDAYPLTKDVDEFAQNEMVYQHGSEIIGIPGGKDKLRSYHPWGYMLDEAAFQPEAGKCYANALPACNKIVLNSSANSSWYTDFRGDIQT